MNGQVDPEFIGAWRWEPKHNEGLTTIYNFNADGTYEFYIGNAMRADLRWYKDVILYWRLNGNTLETFSKDWKAVNKTIVEKKNDAATKKPVIVMQQNGQPWPYVSMDNKPFFAGIASASLDKELKKIYPEDGHDKTILGLWKYQDPNSSNSSYIRLYEDGSYESYTNAVAPSSRTDKGKCKWRVENGIFILTCQGSQPTSNTIKKLNDRATGKPTLVIAEYYPYFPVGDKSPW